MNINKRQKVPTACEQPENLENSVTDKTCRSHTLDTLPPEVLEMVLRLLPLHDVASTVRLVSRHCSAIAAIILNAAFLAVGTKLESVMKDTEVAKTNAKTSTDLLAYNKACNALQLISVQYKTLKAVTWRYTHPPKQQRFPRLCFYAGSLLDDLNELLRLAVKCPSTFVGPYNVDSKVTWFITLCKRFMDFFEKVSERRVNRSTLVSGCKIVDLLDCLMEGRRILSFKVSSPKSGIRSDTVSMKLKYVIKRAWFTCLEVSKATDENSWRDQQRFMYLRLRRLVGNVNQHLFENLHYEHELLLQLPPTYTVVHPSSSTYSGYGEYGGQFFYYGNMNKYAYENKFLSTPISVNAEVETEEVQRMPRLDLVIEVELRCSLDLAPLAVRAILKSDEFENFSKRIYKQQELFLKMNVTCPASMSNRLPGNFTWELRSPRCTRYKS